MRTPAEAARLGGKKAGGWQDRFHRLKLGTKLLTGAGSTYATSATTDDIHHHQQQQSSQLDDSLFIAEEGENTSTPPPSVPHPFPVYQHKQLVGIKSQEKNRESYFSESSTVQDMISCAMPELVVRPLQIQALAAQAAGKPLSEYDNFNPYAPPSASSHGTIFCSPWEGGVVDTLIRSTHPASSRLPPAMDLQERVMKWQEANQSFQNLHQHHSVHQTTQQSDQLHESSQQRQAVVKQAHTVHTASMASNAKMGGSAAAQPQNMANNLSAAQGDHTPSNVFSVVQTSHSNNLSSVQVSSTFSSSQTITNTSAMNITSAPSVPSSPTVAKVKPQPQPRVTVQQRALANAIAAQQKAAAAAATTSSPVQAVVKPVAVPRSSPQHEQSVLHQQAVSSMQHTVFNVHRPGLAANGQLGGPVTSGGHQRPVSMLVQSATKPHQHAQLMRSLSGNNQPQQGFSLPLQHLQVSVLVNE
jgi:hypothetical protein